MQARPTCSRIFVHHLADDADGLCDLAGEAVGVLQVLYQHLLLHQLVAAPGTLRLCRTGSCCPNGSSWDPAAIAALSGGCWAWELDKYRAVFVEGDAGEPNSYHHAWQFVSQMSRYEIKTYFKRSWFISRKRLLKIL